jgi:cytochrome c-type biogenesis protein
MPLAVPIVLLAQLSASLSGHPVAAFGALFLAGLATSLTPCIYPMIPITAGVLAGAQGYGRTGARVDERTSGHADGTGVPGHQRTGAPGGAAGWRRRVGLTLTYALGLALLYATLGLLAGLSGSLFGTVSANPWARFATGNLLLLFALAMLDVIPVAAPQTIVAWAARFAGGSYAGVFAMGATSGLVAAPCGAPAFAAVLTWVGTTQSAALGFAYLFVFSLGMTALLIVVGLFSGTLAALPKAGRWMRWIKRLAGVVLLGMAEYYFIQMGRVM